MYVPCKPDLIAASAFRVEIFINKKWLTVCACVCMCMCVYTVAILSGDNLLIDYLLPVYFSLSRN